MATRNSPGLRQDLELRALREKLVMIFFYNLWDFKAHRKVYVFGCTENNTFSFFGNPFPKKEIGIVLYENFPVCFASASNLALVSSSGKKR